jgi:hypothetical protein
MLSTWPSRNISPLEQPDPPLVGLVVQSEEEEPDPPLVELVVLSEEEEPDPPLEQEAACSCSVPHPRPPLREELEEPPAEEPLPRTSPKELLLRL